MLSQIRLHHFRARAKSQLRQQEILQGLSLQTAHYETSMVNVCCTCTPYQYYRSSHTGATPITVTVAGARHVTVSVIWSTYVNRRSSLTKQILTKTTIVTVPTTIPKISSIQRAHGCAGNVGLFNTRSALVHHSQHTPTIHLTRFYNNLLKPTINIEAQEL